MQQMTVKQMALTMAKLINGATPESDDWSEDDQLAYATALTVARSAQREAETLKRIRAALSLPAGTVLRQLDMQMVDKLIEGDWVVVTTDMTGDVDGWGTVTCKAPALGHLVRATPNLGAKQFLACLPPGITDCIDSDCTDEQLGVYWLVMHEDEDDR